MTCYICVWSVSCGTGGNLSPMVCEMMLLKLIDYKFNHVFHYLIIHIMHTENRDDWTGLLNSSM